MSSSFSHLNVPLAARVRSGGNQFPDRVSPGPIARDLPDLISAVRPAFKRFYGMQKLQSRLDTKSDKHQLLYLRLKEASTKSTISSDDYAAFKRGERLFTDAEVEQLLAALAARVNAEICIFETGSDIPSVSKWTATFVQSLTAEARFELLAPLMGADAPRHQPQGPAYFSRQLREHVGRQLLHCCTLFDDFQRNVRQSFPGADVHYFDLVGGSTSDLSLLSHYAAKLKMTPDKTLVRLAAYASAHRIGKTNRYAIDLDRAKWVLKVWNAGQLTKVTGLPSRHKKMADINSLMTNLQCC